MTVQIQKINLEKLGPLDSIQTALGQANLIYGRNETGKTYLVEFLLSSLFQHSKNWDLRGQKGFGSVQVQGLGPEPVTFSPESKYKLEHFLEKGGQGLPLNLARFLVVKGGELALSASSQGGVGRDVLKQALTNQALLDAIWDGIPATIRDAKLEAGRIDGASRGAIKNRTELQVEIEGLRELLEEIDGSYSRGPAWEIEQEIARVQGELDLQQQAKNHLAYQVNLRLATLEENRATLSLQHLQDLRDSNRDLETLEKEIKRLKFKLKNLEAKSQDYLWLESARWVWEEKGLDQKKAPPAWLGTAGLSGIFLGLIILLVAGVSPLPATLWLGGSLALAGLGLSLYYGIRQRQWLATIDDSRERKAIQDRYQEKFQAHLGSMADLKARLAELAEFHSAAQAAKDQLDEKTHQREMIRLKLENLFIQLTGEKVPIRKWVEKSAELNDRSQILDQEIASARIELGILAVREVDHLEEPPPADYDPARIEELEQVLNDRGADLSSYQTDLDSLKGQAVGRLGMDLGTPWEEVLQGLQDLERQKAAAYQELTAQIVAQIGLTQVLSQLRQEEDQVINQAINAQPVSALLRAITGKYQKLELEEDRLLVSDAFRSYPLAELSTGAREQVQLALRLGIASALCGGEPLFLILDDAFQHSDWQRREWLVQSTLDLARGGWQILYLTMDDHIRDLFLKKVKPVLKKGFKEIVLD